MFKVKALLVCLLAFLGVIFGVALVSLFVCLEGSELVDSLKDLFGSKHEEKPFHLPRREQIPSATEEYDEVQGHEEWFSATSRNLDYHAAVLVAGSRGYHNYRHQADICHAFQVLKEGGLYSDKIITLVYDDIAYSNYNPYRGQIFNKPGGNNVYPGCAKDYTGNSVNRDVLFAVLKGNAKAVQGMGSGRVLEKNPKQRVLFAYSDHGSAGAIGMPVGPPIYADEINAVFKSMHRDRAFKQMVVYLESCYAGSLFAGFESQLQNDVLFVTAADAYESSYATYCPHEGTFQTVIPNATYIGSCLGDLFSVAWLEETEKVDRSEVFMGDQLQKVKLRTSNYMSYRSGSHMKQYGDRAGIIAKQVIGNFFSYFSAPSGWTRSDVKEMFDSTNAEIARSEEQAVNYDQWTADLIGLYSPKTENQIDDPKDDDITFEKELSNRRKVDHAIQTSLEFLIRIGELPKTASVHRYAKELISRGDDVQVVNDWRCLKQMVTIWENHCGRLTDYSRQYTRTFVNLCNTMVSPSSFKHSILHSLC